MDMHNGTHFREIADHRDEIVHFERATAGRKVETKTVAPVASTAGEGWYHDAAITDAAKDALEARSNPYHH